MNENKEISMFDLKDILQDVWKGKFLILALMIFSALIMAIWVQFFVSVKYTADGVLYIYSENIGEIQGVSGVTGAEIEDARTMSTTYIETLKLRSFLTEVSREIDEVYSWKQIKNVMKITSVNGTEYISVSVTTTDPQMSYRIAKCICEKAQTKFSEIFRGGEAIIVDEVVYPKSADSKGGLKKVCISFVAGAVLGVLIIILLNLLDKRLRKSEEISKKHNISILGETMLTEYAKKSKKEKGYAKSENEKIIDDKTDFDTVETYKAMRTNIMFSVPKQDKGNVIVITSASPSEGKTTTSINLALIFAQMGVKVALIDCDLRKPRVHRYMELERGEGVSNIICGYSDIEKATRKNVLENLDVITAGDIPPNPAELIENQSFSDLIEQLQGKYEYIFVDTPPVTVVTDAIVAMKNCTGTILVARQGVTLTDLFGIAVSEIKKSKTKILGAIVHDSKEQRSKYNYYSRGKYGYKYNYKYKYDYRYGDDVDTEGKQGKK